MANTRRRKEMAYQQHLEMLQKSTKHWNKWREKHPKIRPDLSGAHLRGANLSGAHLRGANLAGQDLSNQNLTGANLSGANLSRTLLIGTNLTEATLTDCTIYGIAAWNVQLEHAVQKNLII